MATNCLEAWRDLRHLQHYTPCALSSVAVDGLSTNRRESAVLWMI